MTEFLLHLCWLSLTMSFLILLVCLWSKGFGKHFSAKSRYIIWTVVIFTLCIGALLFRIPAFLTLKISVSIPLPTENISDTAALTASSYTPLPSVTVPASGEVAAEPYIPEPLPAEYTDTLQSEDDRTERVLSAPVVSEHASMRMNMTAVVFSIWALGAVLYLTVNIAAYIRSTHRYARGKAACSAETVELLCAMCRKYEIRHIPRIYVCDAVGSPVLYGYTKPTVLLPDISLSSNALVGILAHELTHYRRGDIRIKLVCLIAESLYWFHPLVHIAAARCNAEMELSCDEEVLSGMDAAVRRTYGSVMLDIVAHCSRRSSLLTTQFNPHVNAVRERLLNILDTTKKKRGASFILAALILCLLTGAVIGCTVRYEDPGERKETVVSVGEGITVIDAHSFAKDDIAGITELHIGRDVETIDFAYLNTLPSLQKVTVDTQNENYTSVTCNTGACAILSSGTDEMLYIPSDDDHLLDLLQPELSVYAPEGRALTLYACRSAMTVYRTQEEHGDAWFLKDIEYNGIRKTLSFDRQITGNCGVTVFDTKEGLVVSHSYNAWSSTMLFTSDRVVEYNPASEENAAFGIPTTVDGMIFYPGEAGVLCYRRIAQNMMAMQTVDWFFALLSADQFWMEEGTVAVDGALLRFHPEKTYTVTDYFMQRGTTLAVFFAELQAAGHVSEYKTPGDMFEANIAKTVVTTPLLRATEIAGLPWDPGIAWQSFRPTMSPTYYFYDRALTYYSTYTYHGTHYRMYTLLLPDGYESGEIFHIGGTGGSASMYIYVQTERDCLRYYLHCNHGTDEVVSVDVLTKEETAQLKRQTAAETTGGSPTAYRNLSDFLTEEQIAVYETARELYGLLIANPAGVEGLHCDGSFHASEGSYTIGDFFYVAARGKYQSYPAFRELCLTAFTETYYDELNRTGTDSAAFMEIDGSLYYRDTVRGGSVTESPDTYELISRTDTEICFHVIGYYRDRDRSDPICSVNTAAFPITMVRTEDGWRFSRFADTAHIDQGVYNGENEAAAYIFEVPLTNGAKAALYLSGNDPSWNTEVHTVQFDGTGVPNTVVLHRFANGTGIGIYHAYVLDGTTGALIPVTPVDEVIENSVEVSSTDDAWILTISGKDYPIDKAQFADYPADMICDIPRFDFIQHFDVTDGQLVCRVGIFCAGNGTGFAKECLSIRYCYDAGRIIPSEIRVEYRMACRNVVLKCPLSNRQGALRLVIPVRLRIFCQASVSMFNVTQR